MENRKNIQRLILSYLIIAAVLFGALSLIPMPGGYTWNPWVINTATTLLFVLLTWLTARLARTDRTPMGILLTGLFLMLFCPGTEKFFLRDEQALFELCSQCIVPFFMSQYVRLRRKDFKYWYFLMLIMGIFCSYTHNGVTIPLCAAFFWLSFRHLKGFFRMACWPMVVGFAIGTTLSLVTSPDAPASILRPDLYLPQTLAQAPSTVWVVLRTLWDTKVFALALALTVYVAYGPKGRQMIHRIGRRHFALCVCLVFSLVSMPFAPLGIDNAVHGVCFFCMFWLLFLVKYMAERYWGVRF